MSVTPIRPGVELTLSAQDGHNEALNILHSIRTGSIRRWKNARVSTVHELCYAFGYSTYNWAGDNYAKVKIQFACDLSSDITIPMFKSNTMKSFYYAIALGRIIEYNTIHTYSTMLHGEYSLDDLTTEYSLAFADTLLTELK